MDAGAERQKGDQCARCTMRSLLVSQGQEEDEEARGKGERPRQEKGTGDRPEPKRRKPVAMAAGSCQAIK